MSTELNLATLNWTTLACRVCGTVSEVFSDDLGSERTIRCRHCGGDLQADDSCEPAPDRPSQSRELADKNEPATRQDAECVPTLVPANVHVAGSKPTTHEPDVVADCVCEFDTASESKVDCAIGSDSESEFNAVAAGQFDPTENDAPFESDEWADESFLDDSGFDDADFAASEFDDVDLDEFDFVNRPKTKGRSKNKRGARESRWASLKKFLEKRRDDFAGAIVSIVVHCVVLLILALIVVQMRAYRGNEIIASIGDQAQMDAESRIDNRAIDEAAIEIVPSPNVEPEEVQVANLMIRAANAAEQPSEFTLPSRESFGRKASGAANWAIGSDSGFEGRSGATRAKLAAANGGTAESEEAVEKGLAWLAQHQLPDGSWSFRDSTRIEGCTCANHGAFDARTGATGMVLLAFLGAGYTHQDGMYQDVVKKGLEWLAAQSDVGDFRYTRQEAAQLSKVGFYIPALYSHGLASIAFCEAYGMTQDRAYLDPARKSLDFIEASQHSGGGWRYGLKMPGDTSVVGWQVMAIVSGRMSGLHVNREVPGRVVSFLDGVNEFGRGTYGYTDKYNVTPATMAIGTLCRMYVHFGFNHAEMERSIKRIAATNPTRNSAYDNYYVMQVLHHWGGHKPTLNEGKPPAIASPRIASATDLAEHAEREKVWTNWNARCRDRLVTTQLKAGHAKGAWNPSGDHSGHGGILCQTALSVMTLEVYYRHMPIYGKDATY